MGMAQLSMRNIFRILAASLPAALLGWQLFTLPPTERDTTSVALLSVVLRLGADSNSTAPDAQAARLSRAKHVQCITGAGACFSAARARETGKGSLHVSRKQE